METESLSSFLNVAAALVVIMPPMALLLAFFIWIDQTVSGEEEDNE